MSVPEYPVELIILKRYSISGAQAPTRQIIPGFTTTRNVFLCLKMLSCFSAIEICLSDIHFPRWSTSKALPVSWCGIWRCLFVWTNMAVFFKKSFRRRFFIPVAFLNEYRVFVSLINPCLGAGAQLTPTRWPRLYIGAYIGTEPLSPLTPFTSDARRGYLQWEGSLNEFL